MLAYLFWHRRRPGVEREEYEERQRQFHALLEVESACFRLDHLPFADGGGYEDWYLVEDWQRLGELNAAAVDRRRRDAHDRAAAPAAEGWGAVYACVRGPAVIPEPCQWLEKPRGTSLDDLLDSDADGTTVWQRQLVLGPAPEICVAGDGPPRARVT